MVDRGLTAGPLALDGFLGSRIPSPSGWARETAGALPLYIVSALPERVADCFAVRCSGLCCGLIRAKGPAVFLAQPEGLGTGCD